jgi:enoyl-CoA hydratase/carnithine racemase
MSAEEAHDRKIINKVVDDSDQLESRALEMAERLARKPQQVLSYSRMLAVRPFRQAFELNGALGIAYQGLAASDYWPAGPAKGPASHQ